MQPPQQAQDQAGNLREVEQKPSPPGPCKVAMKKLESLGATVYPPKDQAEFDWDVLAGMRSQYLAPCCVSFHQVG